MDFKTCTRCEETLPITSFGMGNGKQHGSSRCIDCRRAISRAKYRKQKHQGTHRYGTRDGWISQILASKRHRCRKLGIPFALDRHWLEAGLARGVCAVTGLRFSSLSEARDPYGPHIDRIDPSRGYVPENCQLVVAIYNLAKSDWTHNDVVRMARALVEAEAGREGGFGGSGS